MPTQLLPALLSSFPAEPAPSWLLDALEDVDLADPIALKSPPAKWKPLNLDNASLGFTGEAELLFSVVNRAQDLALPINAVISDGETVEGIPPPLLVYEDHRACLRFGLQAKGAGNGSGSFESFGLELKADADVDLALFLPGDKTETIPEVLKRLSQEGLLAGQGLSPQNALPVDGCMEISFQGKLKFAAELDLAPLVTSGLGILANASKNVLLLDPLSVKGEAKFTLEIQDRFHFCVSRLPNDGGAARYRFHLGRSSHKRKGAALSVKVVTTLASKDLEDLKKKINKEIAKALDIDPSRLLEDKEDPTGLLDALQEKIGGVRDELKKRLDEYRKELDGLFKARLEAGIQLEYERVDASSGLCQWVSTFNQGDTWDPELADAVRSRDVSAICTRVQAMGKTRAELEWGLLTKTSRRSWSSGSSISLFQLRIASRTRRSFETTDREDYLANTRGFSFASGIEASREVARNQRIWSLRLEARPGPKVERTHNFTDLEYRLVLTWSSGVAEDSKDSLEESDLLYLADQIALLRPNMFSGTAQRDFVENLQVQVKQHNGLKKPGLAEIVAITPWMDAFTFASATTNLPNVGFLGPGPFVNAFSRAYLPRNRLFQVDSNLREQRFAPLFLMSDRRDEKAMEKEYLRYLDELRANGEQELARALRDDWGHRWFRRFYNRTDAAVGGFRNDALSEESEIIEVTETALSNLRNLGNLFVSGQPISTKDIRNYFRPVQNMIVHGNHGFFCFRLFCALSAEGFEWSTLNAQILNHKKNTTLPVFVPVSGDKETKS
ncbi:MAG: hypothetical protein JJU05_07525 [Verrucomicrobia bacterium]|nr:hypothetical protein [Verrucomicrobiota bacterium]MCH8527776.1 hypothetical protein [Kiritimatiellia bacterium]